MAAGRKLLLIAIVISLALLMGASLFAPLLAPHDPLSQRLEMRFLPPGSEGFLLGTDNLGRDIFSRVIYGGRSALLVGSVAVGLSLLFGTLVGLGAGLGGRLVDRSLMIVMDAILSFPTVLLAITIVAAFGYGLGQVTVALGIVFVPVYARLVRAEVMAIRQEPFVEASKALGTGPVRRIQLHFLPNMLPKLIVQSAVTFAFAVSIEAALSFLGLGTQPPNPSWGLMLKDARNFLFQAPWLALFPGVALAWMILTFNTLGDLLSGLLVEETL
jgi:ABC-type dipeptide/oligopeptide/nickel transport system permease subunit